MQIGYTFWIMGLPQSGKTSLASSIRQELDLIHLDSDELREHLIPNTTYEQEERELIYKSLISVSHVINEQGRNVIISATGYLEKYRIMANKMIKNCKFIYLECPIEICERRDFKGVYEASRKGSIKTLPIKIVGRNENYIKEHYNEVDVYEFPEQFDLLIDNSVDHSEKPVIALKEYIKKALRNEDTPVQYV